jgi:hypothetical protein
VVVGVVLHLAAPQAQEAQAVAVVAERRVGIIQARLVAKIRVEGPEEIPIKRLIAQVLMEAQAL